MLGSTVARDTILRGIGIGLFDNAGLSNEPVMDVALDVVPGESPSKDVVVNLLWPNLAGGPTAQDLPTDLVESFIVAPLSRRVCLWWQLRSIAI